MPTSPVVGALKTQMIPLVWRVGLVSSSKLWDVPFSGRAAYKGTSRQAPWSQNIPRWAWLFVRLFLSWKCVVMYYLPFGRSRIRWSCSRRRYMRIIKVPWPLLNSNPVEPLLVLSFMPWSIIGFGLGWNLRRLNFSISIRKNRRQISSPNLWPLMISCMIESSLAVGNHKFERENQCIEVQCMISGPKDINL